jgi:ABC-type lipoprotein release transport system permease subunit
VVVVSSVVGTALLASLLPALRASRSDPLASLHGGG